MYHEGCRQCNRLSLKITCARWIYGAIFNTVADLIEECFADTLDYDGRQYVQRMRSAARNRDYMEWFSQSQQKGALPAGYVWEEGGRVVGNLSLIPCTRSLLGFGEKVYLIANVAVREEYRRRGIAAALTRQAIQALRNADEKPPWLHVRVENLAAFELYRSLGFIERLRRTTWHSTPHEEIPADIQINGFRPGGQVEIAPRQSRTWEMQKAWFERAYPSEMGLAHAHVPGRDQAGTMGIYLS